MARPKVADLLAQEEAGAQSSAPAQTVSRPKVSELAAKEDSEQNPGLLKRLGDGLLKGASNALVGVGRTVDRISPLGASLRKGIAAAQDDYSQNSSSGKPGLSSIPSALGAGVSAYADQYLRDPERAPSSEKVLAGFGVDSQKTPRLKMVNGNWVPGIPDNERLQDGRNADGSIKYVGPDQGVNPSEASVLGGVADIIMPTGIPGLGAAKMLGKTMGPVSKMVEKGVEGTAKVIDAATGLKAASKTLGAIEGGMDNLGDALKSRFGTELAPDASKHIETMVKNGIDPEKANASVLFGPNSSASHLERARAETPIGETLRKHHKEFTDEVEGAIRKEIQRIGGVTKESAIKKVKIPETTQEAGELITNAFNKRVDEILNNSQDTYKSLSGRAPGAKIPPQSIQKLNSKLDELAKKATDMGVDSFDDVTESQAKHLLGVVDKIKNSQGDLAATVRGLSGLGKAAFKTKYPLGAIPPDIAELRRLYGDISESVVDGVEAHFGKEVANNLRENNKAIAEMFQDNKLVPSLTDDAASADRIFRNTILQGDSKRIGVIKKYLSPEELQQTKAAALEILNKETIQGDITFRNRLSQKLSDPNDAMNALFDDGELDNLKNLFQLGDRAGKSVLSSSGTGGSLAHQAAGLGDILRPDKWLNKAEEGVDRFAAGRQKKAASRAIGFELDKSAGKAAAQGPNIPTIMGLTDSRLIDGKRFKVPDWRKKGARGYAAQQEEENP